MLKVRAKEATLSLPSPPRETLNVARVCASKAKNGALQGFFLLFSTHKGGLFASESF